VLEVVDHQQQALGGQEPLGGPVGRLAGEHHDRERPDNGFGHILGPSERRQRDAVRTVREVRRQRASRLQCQARLAHSARARQGQQSCTVDAEPVRDRLHVIRAADRLVRRRRQPVRATRSRRRRGQRWEICRQIANDELKEVLGAIEVLEPMLTEIPEHDVARQRIGN
jgi:hypothetical protein